MRNVFDFSVKKLFTRILLFSSFLFYYYNSEAADKLKIPVIVYYNYHPYYDEFSKKDLNSELTATLNAKFHGKDVEFYSEYIPKGRLDKWISDDKWKGVVAWINPKFVSDENKIKFQWSDALVEEKDLVASNLKKPIVYRDTNSLLGKTLGTVLNQRYADVEALMTSGKILRNNTLSQASNIRMLMTGRVDVIFISSSTISYFKKEITGFPERLYFAKIPRNVFTRHVMATKAIPPEIRQKIIDTVNSLHSEKVWKSRLDELKASHIVNQ